MTSLHTYLPQDRLRALIKGGTLPDRAYGSALFADISGFTLLTESLRNSLGPRRGAEEMTRYLSKVYDRLIAEVERYGGCVINFAGDAILCWFDARHGSPEARSTRCALALQEVMRSFTDISLPDGNTTTLAVKVAVATGPARRFIVGDPEVNYIDVLAGDTVVRTSAGEYLAQKGEVLADQVTMDALGGTLSIVEWRTVSEPGLETQFAVVGEFKDKASIPPLPAEAVDPPPADELRVWVHPGVYERERSGQESLMTDFRPCAALFVRFSGIDYDSDEAWGQLDSFIRLMQNQAQYFGGTLIQLTIGDKGSYAYINVGALTMHEDDCRRAVNLALALREGSLALGLVIPMQVGITQGTMFVGKYGSATRTAFGALGDDVNLAARLMMTAILDEILVSGHVRKFVSDEFIVEARPTMEIKGKAEPVPVFSVLGIQQKRSVRLQEPDYALPMVGRGKELEIIFQKLSLVVKKGKGQIIGITGEAGMGKSRLAAEGIRLAHRNKLTGYGGTCKADGVNTPYLVWTEIWNAFFDIDPYAPLRKQIRSIELDLEHMAPDDLDAMPLLGSILGLSLPENDFTHALQPKDRKNQLETLLIKLLEFSAREESGNGGGLLLVLEDLHWIDPVSSDLLENIARAIEELPVLILLTYRPMEGISSPHIIRHLETKAHFTGIKLTELNAGESEQIIRAKLSLLFPEQRSSVPHVLIDRITRRAQGNPFYVEELLNFLHDSGIDPGNEESLNSLELPASLHSLILSRIDQLTSSQQLSLKVASIIGRVFRFEHLYNYHPSLGNVEQVESYLEAMNRLELTLIETPEPDLSYVFKHLITHEVSYESIAFSTRAKLHGQYARYLEDSHPEQIDRFTSQLAYHYEKAQVQDKARFYLTKSGEQAAANFANDQALSYFTRALELDPDESSRFYFDTLMKRERVYDLLGRRTEQHRDLTILSQLADNFEDSLILRTQIDIRLAKLGIDEGDYSAAKASAQAAIKELTPAHEGAPDLLVDALLLEARTMFLTGQVIDSKPQLDDALSQARLHRYRRGEYNALAQLGLWNWYNGDNKTAIELMEQSLALIRQAGDVRRELEILNNLGIVEKEMYRFADSLAYYEKAQKIAKKIGDRPGEATLLNNMGRACIVSGDFGNAIMYCSRAEALAKEVNDQAVQGIALHNKSETYRELGQYIQARDAAEESLKLVHASGYPVGEAYTIENLAMVEFALGAHVRALELAGKALAITREIAAPRVEVSVLTRIGLMQLQLGQIEPAEKSFLLAKKIEEEYKEMIPMFELQAGLAGIELARGDSASLAKAGSLVQGLVHEILQEPPTDQSHILPLWLYLTCIRVLHKNADPRTDSLIRTAYSELQARIDKFTDTTLHVGFMNIPEHKAIAEFAANLKPPF